MLLSIIIPSYNEEGNILELNKRLNETLKDLDYELIYINDGSTDKTLDMIKSIYNKDKTHIKYISFSRNFGKDAALLSGLKHSRGEFTCIIDADLQQNPKYIISMLDHLKKNKDTDEIAMVMKNRKNEGFITKIFKRSFYKIINRLSDTKFVDGASDFRMFRGNVKNAIISLEETNRFTKGIFSYIGFNTEYMYYTVEKRYSGKTKFNIKNQLKYAITGITNNSVKLLHFPIVIGSIIAFISLILILYELIKVFFLGISIPGYTSIFISVLFIGSIQLVFMGIIGIYLGKTYNETKSRPTYIEKEAEGFEEIL